MRCWPRCISESGAMLSCLLRHRGRIRTRRPWRVRVTARVSHLRAVLLQTAMFVFAARSSCRRRRAVTGSSASSILVREFSLTTPRPPNGRQGTTRQLSSPFATKWYGRVLTLRDGAMGQREHEWQTSDVGGNVGVADRRESPVLPAPELSKPSVNLVRRRAYPSASLALGCSAHTWSAKA